MRQHNTSWLIYKNVKTGIVEDALHDMVVQGIYGIFMEVARGKEPVKGKDGHFIFYYIFYFGDLFFS